MRKTCIWICCAALCLALAGCALLPSTPSDTMQPAQTADDRSADAVSEQLEELERVLDSLEDVNEADLVIPEP